MGFWSETWEAAKSIGSGISDVFVGIGSVLILVVWAIGYAIFSVVDHLYTWIDKTIERIKKYFTSTVMLPPEETENYIKTLSPDKRKKLEPYKPNVKRTILAAMDGDKVVSAQIVSTTQGFDDTIQEAFDRGEIVEQPIV